MTGLSLALGLVTLVVAVVLPAGIVAFVHRHLAAASPAEAALARQLMDDGRRARATVLRAEPTGLEVGQDLQCVLRFQLQPLDGGTPFAATKKLLVPRSAVPRPGEVWPAWVAPADPTRFVVGMPDGPSSEQIPLYREFGIRHPLDHAA